MNHHSSLLAAAVDNTCPAAVAADIPAAAGNIPAADIHLVGIVAVGRRSNRPQRLAGYGGRVGLVRRRSGLEGDVGDTGVVELDCPDGRVNCAILLLVSGEREMGNERICPPLYVDLKWGCEVCGGARRRRLNDQLEAANKSRT